MGIVCAAERRVRASNIYMSILNHSWIYLETNQSLGLAPAGSAVQVIPTSPDILDAGMPKGWRRRGTAGEVGDWALLPIIIRFHCSTITILWKNKHTALKLSTAALATSNSGSSREGRGDVGFDTGKGTGSRKSGKDESAGRDDFELHAS